MSDGVDVKNENGGGEFEGDAKGAMKALAYTDFETTMELLYVQSKRYVVVFEQAMKGHSHAEGECTVSLGADRWYLTQAAAAAEEAYVRAENAGAFEEE